MRNQQNSYDEIISRLRDIQVAADNFGNRQQPTPRIPLIDPTENVKELVDMERRHAKELAEMAKERQDDLREQSERFSDKLYAERRVADSEAKRAEAGRIDALLVANTNNVALALEKQGAQAQAQDKRIAALEQNQYQGVGATGQRSEGRKENQWIIGLAVVIGIAVIEVMAKFWR
jgi:hypothetical protein